MKLVVVDALEHEDVTEVREDLLSGFWVCVTLHVKLECTEVEVCVFESQLLIVMRIRINRVGLVAIITVLDHVHELLLSVSDGNYHYYSSNKCTEIGVEGCTSACIEGHIFSKEIKVLNTRTYSLSFQLLTHLLSLSCFSL